MNSAEGTSYVRPQDLAEETIALVRRWLAEAAQYPVDPAAARLAGVLQEPNGLEFTVRFIDEVIRLEDNRAAAKKLREISAITPRFLGWLRLVIRLGGALSKFAPGIIVPLARRALRRMVSHLIIDATDSNLGPAISKIRRDGVGLNVNLLGEYILGEREAANRLKGTHQLLDRDDVDYVSIKVSSTVAPHNHWAFDEAVNHIEDQLVPLFAKAAQSSPAKFINLDMEEYKDLDITVAVFKRIMDRPEFHTLEAGIVLQAYLPDSLKVMMGLQQWAATRVEAGGSPIKVRVVKGANLPMEIVDSLVHGWQTTTWDTKQDSDTNFKAVLDYAFTQERIRNVKIGVAGHNLFDLALAWLLAQARGVTQGVDFEMLLGMATGQAEAVKKEVGALLLYTPVVHPEEFDVAIAYLVRRLEEGASEENFMSVVFELADNEELFDQERQRFLASLENLVSITGDGSLKSYSVPCPSRTQDRRTYDEAGEDVRVEALVQGGIDRFTNRPNTDPNLTGNRQWGREIASRMVGSHLGEELRSSSIISTQAELDDVLTTGVQAARRWQQLSSTDRARIIYRAGERLEAHRADLLEVMGSECGKTLDQGDPEISEAIDFAHYYAGLAMALEDVDGAQYAPRTLTAVVPPWNFPTAIPTGGTVAALAAGSAVVFKAAPSAARTGAVIIEALWEAGVPRDVLQYVQFPDNERASMLIADPRVDQVILTGAYDTAMAFRHMRPELRIFAETSGKNATIVTANADLDLAAQDVALSAFGHAGQKCSASSLAILVGSAAHSARFRNQLLDAVRSLEVGTPDDLTSEMGPVIAPPSGKLLRGLTTLSEGESWAIKPKPIDSDHPLARNPDGEIKLWSPGVRQGVVRGSEYHHVEYFGPILGIMTAETLDEAIDIVNDIEYGLTSGLQSLDRDEIAHWLSRIEAGNLYVNRGITGAIVRRQSFGGWKKSAVGPGTKAGGPSYLFGLGQWNDAPVTGEATPPRPQAAPLLNAAERSGLDAEDIAWLRSALGTDAKAWDQEFGVAKDDSGLGVERNILRYRPTQVTIRAAADAPIHHTLRAVAAAVAAQASPILSTQVALPKPIAQAFTDAGITMVLEDDEAWHERIRSLVALTGPQASARIRIVAGPSRTDEVSAVFRESDGKPDIAVYGDPVVAAGRVEMLPHLLEQAVSITAHRFGTPNHVTKGVI